MDNLNEAINSLLPREESAFRAVLQTPYDSVYKLSPDGSTFLEPRLLRGTPGPEALKKREAKKRLELNPGNKALKDAHKRYADNSSKFKKIREIFGEDSKYHPNQLIGKQHLPAGGLCQKEPMYRLACKISDLQHLYSNGKLAMDPFDFIRWRLLKKVESLRATPGDSPKNIRTVVYKLCDDSEDSGTRVYQDTVMRQAVLLSAAQRNHLGNYGHKAKNRKNGTLKQGLLPYKQAAPRRRVRISAQDVMDSRPKARPDAAPPTQRRAQLAAGPPVYAGVNAYRAAQQQQQPSPPHISTN
ncbi:hypothetical protein V8C35DRAFT_333625 [Trichoderma chlorosporum]